MNRLTKSSPLTEYEAMNLSTTDLYMRLKTYEDSGLEPEQCAKYAQAEKEGRYIVLKEPRSAGVHRLEEIARADIEDRLLVLPCNVGDTVYYHFQFKNKRVLPFTRKAKVKKIYCNRKTLEVDVELMDAKESGIMKTFHAEDFGKTVFPTREDAEKALEGMNNDER